MTADVRTSSVKTTNFPFLISAIFRFTSSSSGSSLHIYLDNWFNSSSLVKSVLYDLIRFVCVKISPFSSSIVVTILDVIENTLASFAPYALQILEIVSSTLETPAPDTSMHSPISIAYFNTFFISITSISCYLLYRNWLYCNTKETLVLWSHKDFM